MWLRTISGNYVNAAFVSEILVSCPNLEDRYWRVMAVLSHIGGGIACLGCYDNEADARQALDDIIETLKNKEEM